MEGVWSRGRLAHVEGVSPVALRGFERIFHPMRAIFACPSLVPSGWPLAQRERDAPPERLGPPTAPRSGFLAQGFGLLQGLNHGVGARIEHDGRALVGGQDGGLAF